MPMAEKQIIDFTRFEIYRAKRAAAAGSIMEESHRIEADVLSELLESYGRMNTLEREAFKQSGMSLSELLSVPPEEPGFRAKDHGGN